jgi:hypothetical protein
MISPAKFTTLFYQEPDNVKKNPKVTTDMKKKGTAMPAAGKKGYGKVHKDKTKVANMAAGVKLLKDRLGEPKDEVHAKGKDHHPKGFKQKKGSKGNVPNSGGFVPKKK